MEAFRKIGKIDIKFGKMSYLSLPELLQNRCFGPNRR